MDKEIRRIKNHDKRISISGANETIRIFTVTISKNLSAIVDNWPPGKNPKVSPFLIALIEKFNLYFSGKMKNGIDKKFIEKHLKEMAKNASNK